jgi:hypothetical protein
MLFVFSNDSHPHGNEAQYGHCLQPRQMQPAWNSQPTANIVDHRSSGFHRRHIPARFPSLEIGIPSLLPQCLLRTGSISASQLQRNSSSRPWCRMTQTPIATAQVEQTHIDAIIFAYHYSAKNRAIFAISFFLLTTTTSYLRSAKFFDTISRCPALPC